MQLHSKLTLAGLFIVALAAAGCSVTGALIGSQIDDANRNNVNLPATVLDTLTAGTEIELVFTDRSTLDATYLGLKKSATSDPHETRVLLQSGNSQASMPYALVEAVHLGHGNSARTIGMGIGALIDIGVVVWAVMSEVKRNWERDLAFAGRGW